MQSSLCGKEASLNQNLSIITVFIFYVFFLTQTQAEEKKSVKLPPPNEKHRVYAFSKVVGWPAGVTPQAPENFKVTKFADGLRNPRWIYTTPTGEIFVAESGTESKSLVNKIGMKLVGASKSQNTGRSANRITWLVDKDGDGVAESRGVYLEKLNQPLGMLVIKDKFYVADTDAVWMYPYKAGLNKIDAVGKKILDLPAGGYNNHWTRNLLANADGSKIFISVGSASNVAEHGMDEERRRANILIINPDGSEEKVYASGLRNPVGMALNPEDKKLWTAVNERDNLGDDLVPDYITSVVEGGFYGWPYSYWGAHPDPRLKGEGKDLIKKAIVPDVDLGSHTASLGLAFYDKKTFPEKYHNGAFIGQHGSWNRSEISGYKVVFVPFKNGKPSGPPEDFLTGFIKDIKTREVYGRPVGVTVLNDGSLLVADDSSNTIWKIAYSKQKGK